MPDHIFLVTEFVETDLRTIILTKRLSFQNVKVLLYNLLQGLETLHAANVMHRDLKPANILVDSALRIKICDFGMSRTLPQTFAAKGSRSTKNVRE